jgi:hypothetical protein
LAIALNKWQRGWQQNWSFNQSGLVQALAFDGKDIWEARSSPNAVIRRQASDGTVISTTSLPSTPMFMEFDGANLIIVGNSTLIRLRTSDSSLITYSVPSIGIPGGLALRGYYIFITNTVTGQLLKLDYSGVVRGASSVGTTPGLLINLAEYYLAVANNGDSAVVLVDTSSLNVIRTYPTPSPSGLTFDGRYLWVGSTVSNTLTKVDWQLSSNSQVAQYNLSYSNGSSHGNILRLLFDADYLWATTTNNELCRITIATGSCGSSWGSISNSATPALAFDGASIWTAFNSQTMRLY